MKLVCLSKRMYRLTRGPFRFSKYFFNNARIHISSVCPISTANIHAKPHESFLTPNSAVYIEMLYNSWLENPSNVHASWNSYFRAFSKDSPVPYQPPPLSIPAPRHIVPLSQVAPSLASDGDPERVLVEHLAVQAIIRCYQAIGHVAAKVDPLNITNTQDLGAEHDSILREYLTQFKEEDMQKQFRLPITTRINGTEGGFLSLGEILKRLNDAYCKNIGIEYMFIHALEKCNWIRERFETPGAINLDSSLKIVTLKRLIRAYEFEGFLAKKWSSEKRFGLEGCEVLIPAMCHIIDTSTAEGVDSYIIGMPHRGRLNVLANVCHKPLTQLFTQFSSLEAADDGAGDVKYHLGTYIERVNKKTGVKIRMAIAANPSHLEAVDPVVQGRTRAEQFARGDKDGQNTMSILIHGDAAFAGQGVVFETMHLSALPDYTVRGTIHIVVNNQVGFTTDPRFSRSSRYCTDVARVVKAPIFHVNGDDPESVIYVCEAAAKWRAKYHKDVVIDIVSYRRNGHNEMDEPMFTQPFVYRKISKHKPIAEKYSDKLINEGIVTAENVKDYHGKYQAICEKGFEQAQKETHINYKDWLESRWINFFKGKDPLKCEPTGVSKDTLLHIGKHFSSPPPGDFVIHKGIERILKNRRTMLEAGKVDWAMGEAMAFGSLLKEGVHVRLSGQDVERGTFSHRHHVIHHQTVDKQTYRLLSEVYPDQAKYTVCNSSLSEYGVLGFEVGYSLSSPNCLVCWEAQFGDFNNTAQCIIDQFISSGQTKWIRQSGIVLLQPHGSEGMGPEHSSARLERFLIMSDEDQDVNPPDSEVFEMKQIYEANWIIANCTTPANYFHILRRQMKFPFRKPLIYMSPKSLLRHPDATSLISEMTEETSFKRIIPETGSASHNVQDVKKLIFCSGKVYYDFNNARKEKQLEDTIAICRIEQLSPFPFDLVRRECSKYPNALVQWGQEEHKNQGPWTFVEPRFRTCLDGEDAEYLGRATSASPSTGSKAAYIKEYKALMEASVDLR